MNETCTTYGAEQIVLANESGQFMLIIMTMRRQLQVAFIRLKWIHAKFVQLQELDESDLENTYVYKRLNSPETKFYGVRSQSCRLSSLRVSRCV